jgi:hypothetical protein
MDNLFQTAAQDLLNVGEVSSDRRTAVKQLMRLDSMATLFESIIDTTRANPEDATELLLAVKVPPYNHSDFKIWSSNKAPDFSLAGGRASDERHIYTPNEMLFGIESILENPALYIGPIIALQAASRLADRMYKNVDGTPAPDFFQEIEKLNKRGHLDMIKENSVSEDALLLLPMALPIYARGKNAPVSAVEPSEALWWFFRSGGFRNTVEDGLFNKLSKCPAGAHMVGLMSLPLYANSQRKAPAISHFTMLANDMIRTDEVWRLLAATVVQGFTAVFEGCAGSLAHTYPEDKIRTVLDGARSRKTLLINGSHRPALPLAL